MTKEVSIWIKLYALYDFKNDQITLLYRYSNVRSLTMVFIHPVDKNILPMFNE